MSTVADSCMICQGYGRKEASYSLNEEEADLFKHILKLPNTWSDIKISAQHPCSQCKGTGLYHYKNDRETQKH